MLTKKYYVYIVTNKKHGTLYTGITSNIARRAEEHKTGAVEGFTRRYGTKRLVYVEVHHDVNEAIRREKRLKEWQCQWKIDLIESINPDWLELNLHDYA